MLDWIKEKWNAFWLWCKRSETIVWARVQVLVGSIWTVLVQTDLSPVLDPKWLTVWVVASGAITEALRRIPGKTDV